MHVSEQVCACVCVHVSEQDMNCMSVHVYQKHYSLVKLVETDSLIMVCFPFTKLSVTCSTRSWVKSQSGNKANKYIQTVLNLSFS